MASLPLAPTSSFPTEIYIHILSYFTVSTLAVCCRVSELLLVLASELLWTDVVLDRPDQLQLLFQSVSKKHESSIMPLPASLAPHLALGRIQHLTLTSPDLLRTPLVLGSRFRRVIRPKRMALHGACRTISTRHSVFGPIRPREVAYVFPSDDYADLVPMPLVHQPAPPRLRTNHVVVVLQNVQRDHGFWLTTPSDEISALFFGKYHLPDLSVRVPQYPTSLKYVLLPSACEDRQALVGFLAKRRRAGALNSEWFRARPGSVTVEVPTEEARRSVEAGLATLPAEIRRLVLVDIGAGQSWKALAAT